MNPSGLYQWTICSRAVSQAFAQLANTDKSVGTLESCAHDFKTGASCGHSARLQFAILGRPGPQHPCAGDLHWAENGENEDASASPTSFMRRHLRSFGQDDLTGSL